MIQVEAGILNLSKAIIADIFIISRSAVTQSCRKSDSLENDFVKRMYSTLMKAAGAKCADHVNARMVDILQDIRVAAKTRTVQIRKAGRKRMQINFTALKRIIRAIVSEIISTFTAGQMTADEMITNNYTPTAQELGQFSFQDMQRIADSNPNIRRYSM